MSVMACWKCSSPVGEPAERCPHCGALRPVQGTSANAFDAQRANAHVPLTVAPATPSRRLRTRISDALLLLAVLCVPFYSYSVGEHPDEPVRNTVYALTLALVILVPVAGLRWLAHRSRVVDLVARILAGGVFLLVAYGMVAAVVSVRWDVGAPTVAAYAATMALPVAGAVIGLVSVWVTRPTPARASLPPLRASLLGPLIGALAGGGVLLILVPLARTDVSRISLTVLDVGSVIALVARAAGYAAVGRATS